jgi:hypothetical protein
MNSLFSTIANSPFQMWEALTIMAASFTPVFAVGAKLRHVELDRHTKHDIGLQPGSITWI